MGQTVDSGGESSKSNFASTGQLGWRKTNEQGEWRVASGLAPLPSDGRGWPQAG